MDLSSGLDNISLGYSFNNIINENSHLRIYTTALNLFTITRYTGLDPEVFDGIDRNIFPRPRTFMFGASLEF